MNACEIHAMENIPMKIFSEIFQTRKLCFYCLFHVKMFR